MVMYGVSVTWSDDDDCDYWLKKTIFFCFTADAKTTANQTGSDKGLLMLCMEAGSNIKRVVVAVSNSQHGVLGIGQRSPTDTGASGRHASSWMLQLML